MKCFTVTSESSGTYIREGLVPEMSPYPHVLVGSTKVPIGARDKDSVVQVVESLRDCPKVGELLPVEARECPICGFTAPSPEKKSEWWCPTAWWHREELYIHSEQKVLDCGVMKAQKGTTLLVAPQEGDDRALVLWKVESGFRGGSSIYPGEDTRVVYSQSGDCLRSWSYVLSILRPGQTISANRNGRRMNDTEGVLTYDGQKVTVIFDEHGLNRAQEEGELL